ncbi:MAG: MFS transporter [Anaerolineaceae bacterium]|jgi:MFS family permease
MEQAGFKVYGYRWVVLIVYMLVVAINQLMWITFAPITSDATQFYKVSDLSIGLLSMSFMIVYIIFSFPASWVIDTYGIKVGVGIGAVLTGVFGLLRGILGADYNWVLISQIGIAVGQPFVLNALTTVAARWFPVRERATAAGMGSLAMYLGIVVGLALTPYLILRHSIVDMLIIYGSVALVSSLVFLVFSREQPPTPPCPAGMEVRSLVLDGLKDALHNKNFLFLMAIFFVGLGAFNAVTTWIENIVAPRGFSSTQAGIIGGLMIVGGVVGAIILPTLSDRYHRRKPFIVMALAGAVVGLAGITYATSYTLLLVAAFALGFFLLSSGPIGFTYGAEVTYPTPEGTSNGLLLMMGQISGIIFIFGMNALEMPPDNSMTLSMVILIVLMALSLVLSGMLKESKAPLAAAGPAETVSKN